MVYTKIYINDIMDSWQAIPNIELLTNKKILITGATGLICSAIVDTLIVFNDSYNLNNEIYVAARNIERVKNRFNDFIDRKDVITVKYDALKTIDFNYSFDYIIHGASPANPRYYMEYPVETMRANFIGLDNLFQYIISNPIERLLYISSSEVYGVNSNTSSLTDNEYGYVDILKERSSYPSSKRASETLCISYSKEYNIESVIVRPGHVYGPTASIEDNRISSAFFYDALEGKDLIMKSSGAQLRSYCYVLDCVTSILTALINGRSCLAYNISNSDSVVTIRELVEEIASVGHVRLLYENPSDIELKGFNVMTNSSLDSSSLEMLGWKGLFDLHKGVDHTFRILKEQ